MKERLKNISKSRTMVALLFLVMISVVCLPGLSARFFSKASESTQARVATFKIDFKEGENTVNWIETLKADIKPGDDANESTINVINNSEVAVTYDITVENLSGNIKPLEVTFNGENSIQTGDNKWTFTKEMLPVGTEETYGLKIDWKEDKSYVDSNLEYMGMVDYFTITVSATQKD